jgi:hypothetical protein
MDESIIIKLAAECRHDAELVSHVKRFAAKSKLSNVARVMAEAGVPADSATLAEVIFAQGALILTSMAQVAIQRMRDDLVEAGHPDCSSGEVCPSSGEACSKVECPFYSGLHPILHMDAMVAKEEVDFSPAGLMALARTRAAVEA